MKKKATIKFRLTKGEKILFLSCVFFASTIILVQVFCGATTGNLSLSIEKIKYDIDSQEKKNESLQMQVNELTSYDKIKDVVKSMGLAYNNENIIVIDK